MYRKFDPNAYGNPSAQERHKPNSSGRILDPQSTHRSSAPENGASSSVGFTPATLSPTGHSIKAVTPVTNAHVEKEVKDGGFGSVSQIPSNSIDITWVESSNPPQIQRQGHETISPKGYLKGQQSKTSTEFNVKPEDGMSSFTFNGRNADEHSSAILNAASLTPEEQLQIAREQALRKISLRNRARDQGATTSLGDLSLARESNQTAPMIHAIPPGNLDKPASTSDNFRMNNRQKQNGPTTNDKSSVNVAPLRAGNNNGGAILIQHHLADSKWNNNTQRPIDGPRSGWDMKEDLRPIKADLDALSNAWGSSIPSDASQASGDSVQALHFGKMAPKRPQILQTPLLGFDGRLQPPPIDWHDRPRFHNDIPDFRDTFARWIADVVHMSTRKTESAQYGIVPVEDIVNLALHPDGIGMTSRHFTVNERNAARYGYQDVEDTTKYAGATNPEDFEDWGKLDLSRPENQKFKDECADTLVANWVANVEKRRAIAEARAKTKQAAKEAKLVYKSEINPNQPDVNIYIRPAVSIDIPQIHSIYNYYVQHSARTAELEPVPESDIRDRLDDSKSNKLPFIVAVMRNTKSMIKPEKDARYQAWRSNGQSIQDTDSTHGVLKGIERVVGWACAQDLTAVYYVERISVELELYVDPDYRQKGVGRCLMDQIFESLDRGYVKRSGYPFHCAPEVKSLYSPGGERDIHKILLIIRKYKFPIDLDGRPIRAGTTLTDEKKEKFNDREDDYDYWMKEWLEAWGFQQEGLLCGVGAKKGRFLDAVYMGRETMWQPAEGRVPDPLPGA